MVKLNLGSGPNKMEGFINVDSCQFDNVDVVCNLGNDPWPWEDGSVDEVLCSHMVEHLTAAQRIHFVNELYRVLDLKGKATIITPHWASCRAYGDLTHQWPPVSEFWFYYLKKEWRMANAPHNDKEHNPDGYSCDFDAVWGYGMNQSIVTRNAEHQQFAMNNYKEAITDIHATLTKRKV
jgi:Methyltransferase domain